MAASDYRASRGETEELSLAEGLSYHRGSQWPDLYWDIEQALVDQLQGCREVTVRVTIGEVTQMPDCANWAMDLKSQVGQWTSRTRLVSTNPGAEYEEGVMLAPGEAEVRFAIMAQSGNYSGDAITGEVVVGAHETMVALHIDFSYACVEASRILRERCESYRLSKMTRKWVELLSVDPLSMEEHWQ